MFSAPCKPQTSAALLAWYKQQARDLPWRDSSEPYAVWVSEIMLQQTQVKTVLPRYLHWFEIFPDISTLATASLDDVLKAWEGLGYYRRARFLHAAARQIMDEHQGCFPRDFKAIMALPGIGRSTAGAISSFCFASYTPVLDGNVKRVLRRWYGKAEASDKVLWQWAQQVMDTSNEPILWNQAMMELGATLCAAKKAQCAACPVAVYCASAGDISEDVGRNKKKNMVKDIHWQVHLYQCSKRGLWLQRRADSGIWAGLWSPPIEALTQIPSYEPCHIHTLTHRRLHLYVKHMNNEPEGDGCWVQDISTLALPTGIHHLLQRCSV